VLSFWKLFCEVKKGFIMSEAVTIDTIKNILTKNVNKEYSLSREEAIAIMNLPEDDMPLLMEMAGSLRKKYKGNHVSIHLLTNARSGNCSQNCAYCAQSCRSKAEIEKYKWVNDEKLYSDNAFVHDNHLSRHCIGLSGMKFTDEEIKELAEKIRVMKAQGTHLCCSIGFLTEKQALMLKEAGLDRINHNLNSSRSYYHNICTTHTYEQRVNNIHMLQRLGFEICSGGIIGMGESKEDIVDMLLDLREIQPEALPINFLLPIPGTPLENADTSVLTPSYCMKVLCLARLMVPQSDIRCAAGREVYFKGREKELLSIVDSIFASGYLTADGQGISDTIKTITDAGFTYEIESD
jgi:biotin synthase